MALNDSAGDECVCPRRRGPAAHGKIWSSSTPLFVKYSVNSVGNRSFAAFSALMFFASRQGPSQDALNVDRPYARLFQVVLQVYARRARQ